MTPPNRSARRPLWRERNFAIFWSAQTLSAAGDSFAYIAVPLLVLRATGSVTQMGLLTGVAGAASICAGIGAGVLVDRLDRRTLLICCDLARMVLYGLIPLVWAFGPQVWLLYVILPACEAIGMVFQVTYVTAVRNLVDADRITEANGFLYASMAAVGVAGPLLAGLVAGLLGPAAAIAFDAVSFALSAAGAFFIRLRVQERPDAAPGRGRPWTEFMAGARFLWRHPVLRSLTFELSIYIFLTFGLTNVLIYDLRHDLRQSYAVVGVVLGVAALGTVAGSMVTARLRRKIGFGASWIAPVAGSGVAIACIGLTRAVPVIAALAAIYMACESVGGICSMSLRQEVTPDHLLGRVTSAFWTIHGAPGPVGAALLGWAAGRYGVGPVLVTAGTGCLLLAAAALFTPIRLAAPERMSTAA
ncbi:MAG TPA: MFS transporter [Streptosporangiaceae bacterium]|nr:MFS transporter [Streptosporangiaceae bacterium]